MSSDDCNSNFPPVVHPFCGVIQDSASTCTNNCTAAPPAESRTGEFSNTSSNHPDLVDANAARNLYPRLTQEDVCPPEDEDRPHIISLAEAALRLRKPLHPHEDWFTLRQLMSCNIPPLNWVIPNLLPPGLTFLAGPPKVGKSWLALDLALAVARGGAALGAFPCQPAGVIYIALEDSKRRLYDRINMIYPDSMPFSLLFRGHLACPAMPEFIPWLELQLSQWRNTRLVVVDTFGRISEDKGAKAGYKSDYQETAALQELATRHDLNLLMPHHTRKAPSADPFDMVSGTFGVTGAADTLMVMDKKPDDASATLHIRGRDVEYQSLSLAFQDGLWRYQGQASAIQHTSQELQVINALKDEPCGLTIHQLGSRLTCSKRALKDRLVRMKDRGKLKLGEGNHWQLNIL